MNEDQIQRMLARLFKCAPEDIDGYIILADIGPGFFTHQHNVNRKWMLNNVLKAYEQMETPDTP